MNKEYARLKEGGWLLKARQSREANLTIRILNKERSFGGKRGDVGSQLRNGMKVEDWCAICQPIFNCHNAGMDHLLALYLEAKRIETV
jgi:hypothetical protein